MKVRLFFFFTASVAILTLTIFWNANRDPDGRPEQIVGAESSSILNGTETVGSQVDYHRKYFLVIGLDQYMQDGGQKNGVASLQLKHAVNDANSVATLLENDFGYRPAANNCSMAPRRMPKLRGRLGS